MRLNDKELQMNKTIMLATLALALASTAQAQPPNEYVVISGASCKVAGTNGGDANNKFAAKAIGGRNESTTGNVFVICPMTQTPTPAEGGVITAINLSAYTMDNATRAMTCTAVVGSLTRYIDPMYSAKTFNVTGTGVVATWNAADFGGTAGDGIPGSAWVSVTCLMPAQTGIGLIYTKLNDRIE
jgi:hypothetical protein